VRRLQCRQWRSETFGRPLPMSNLPSFRHWSLFNHSYYQHFFEFHNAFVFKCKKSNTNGRCG